MAITYARNQWAALGEYLTQGFLAIDNNAAERPLKRGGNRKKNWLFAGHDAARSANAAARESQRRLAEEVTRLIHGEEGLRAAQKATAIFFGEAITGLDDAQLAGIFADVPSAELPRSSLEGARLNIVDAFSIDALGLAKSKGEARRTIAQGGAYVNNDRAENIDLQLTQAHLASESCIALRSGKKKYALLRFVD